MNDERAISRKLSDLTTVCFVQTVLVLVLVVFSVICRIIDEHRIADAPRQAVEILRQLNSEN